MCFSHVQCQRETFFSTSPFEYLLMNCNLHTQYVSMFNRNPFPNSPLTYWTLKASFMPSWQTKTPKTKETTVEKLKKGTGNRRKRWWRAEKMEGMEGMEESNTENQNPTVKGRKTHKERRRNLAKTFNLYMGKRYI